MAAVAAEVKYFVFCWSAAATRNGSLLPIPYQITDYKTD